jgi:hypothetical protein
MGPVTTSVPGLSRVIGELRVPDKATEEQVCPILSGFEMF